MICIEILMALLHVRMVTSGYYNPEICKPECRLSSDMRREIKSYQPKVNEIIDAIVSGQFKGATYKSLQNFTDTYGPRFTGFVTLENAIDFLVDEFEKNGLENVQTEEVPVRQWVRRTESAILQSSKFANLKILGLGGTVPTGWQGITASVVVVETFSELKRLPDEDVNGKIVLYVPKWNGFGSTVPYRNRGAIEAARKGAVAALVRSITPFSIGSPHTGSTSYEVRVPKIPVASVTAEDADRLLRYYRSGKSIVIRLKIDSGPGIETTSRNTMGELTGTQFRNTSIIVLSGHVDSWDVGVGAVDDAGGVYVAWKAVQYLKALGLRPRRTIRAILWTAKEMGLAGRKFHEEANKHHEKELFNFMLESDSGTFDPLGLDFTGMPEAECIVREVLNLLAPIHATMLRRPSTGAPDLVGWLRRGFPGGGLVTKNERYFWFHHTDGDSMLVENSASLDKCTAVFAAVAYVIADLKDDLPKDVY